MSTRDKGKIPSHLLPMDVGDKLVILHHRHSNKFLFGALHLALEPRPIAIAI